MLSTSETETIHTYCNNHWSAYNMNTIREFLGRNNHKPEVSETVQYHGLQNQGATCYLSSILQVLFMTEDFRERVKSFSKNNPVTEHIDRELSDLFIKLEGNNALTNDITNKLKINNVNEQRDAAEVYENILRLTSPGACQIFHGELTNRNKCQKCDTETENVAGFWHLPLPLMDFNNEHSVARGLENFFHPSVVSGDNQVYCETCDEKCNAVLDCAVKRHPEVLVLLMKRFEFDFTQKAYVKSSCVVDIPNTIHIQNQIYELYGLVEHLNEQRSGRYISTIKSQHDGRWYTFDDSFVTVSKHQYFQGDPTEKSSTAYLLFYQRQTATMYNGLLNLGATCYLNSILQVLFMTEDFKKSVTRHTRNNLEKEHIDRELGDLFSELEKRHAYTYKIIKRLKINNVDEQRDAAEYYEKILRLASPEASQIFHGELQNSNTCLKCRAQTESTTRFWHLPLSLLDTHKSYSVHRSIKDFIHREVQMYCGICKEECNVLLKCDLKHHPDVLVILLKRFEYDDRHMRNVKNNRLVDVPYTLQMPLPYELYACVEHFGELGFGHYIATIQSRDDGRWYVFDDMNISVIHKEFQEHPMERSQSAYLLFYQKKKDNISGDDREKSASTPENMQAENAIAAQNTEENKEEREDTSRGSSMLSDKTNLIGDAIHAKQTPRRDQKITCDDHKEMIEDGQELNTSDEPDKEETHELDVNKLADSFKTMSISDHKDAMFLQVDNVMETQSHEEIQQEGIALNSMTSKHYSTHVVNGWQVNNFQYENESNIGAGASSAIKNAYSHENLMNIHGNMEIVYKLKLTIRQNDLDSPGECAEIHPQPFKINYPDDEDIKRLHAVETFIRNEQIKEEQAHCIPHSGSKSLPPEVSMGQLKTDKSGVRECEDAKSRDKKAVQRKRSQSCNTSFDGVEGLGVTREGETDCLTPRKRQSNEQNTDSGRMKGCSQDPGTRLLTHV